METLTRDIFRELLLSRRPILDVRAPVEFAHGSIPGSVNLPILDNEQRHEIGTIYKEKGHAAAVKRGHELVTGPVKEARIHAWSELARKNENLILTCFRGGMRSRLSQEWLNAAGFERPRIAGGYKAFRAFLLEELSRLSHTPMLVVTGATGSGKTLVVEKFLHRARVVDLEGLARHRGSAFGAYPDPQPSQIDFENRLARELIRLEGDKPLLVEDESRMIGRLTVPEAFFACLRESPVVLVEESLASRVRLTHELYVLNVPEAERAQVFSGYVQAVKNISRKLGGARFGEVLGDLEAAIASGSPDAHVSWIEKVLHWYYDPLYAKSFEKRAPKVVFRGSRTEVQDFLMSRKPLA